MSDRLSPQQVVSLLKRAESLQEKERSEQLFLPESTNITDIVEVGRELGIDEKSIHQALRLYQPSPQDIQASLDSISAIPSRMVLHRDLAHKVRNSLHSVHPGWQIGAHAYENSIHNQIKQGFLIYREQDFSYQVPKWYFFTKTIEESLKTGIYFSSLEPNDGGYDVIIALLNRQTVIPVADTIAKWREQHKNHLRNWKVYEHF